MRYFFLSILVLLLLGSTVVYAQTAPSLAAAEWVKFSAPEGRFTVLFPELPKTVDQEEVETGNQGVRKHVYYALGKDLKDSVLVVADAEASSAPADQQQALDRAIDGMVKEGNGTLLHKDNISLDGYPGRDLEFSDDSSITKARLYGVERHLYMLLYVWPKSSDAILASKNAAKFFSSFKLIATK
jgi:hypothetical protein